MKHNVTDLSLLVDMVRYEDRAAQPLGGEGAAYKRLARRGLIRRMPANYGAGEWYTATDAGKTLVHGLVAAMRDVR